MLFMTQRKLFWSQHYFWSTHMESFLWRAQKLNLSYILKNISMVWFFSKYWGVLFVFFFLILNWAVIWVKINKKNLKVKAARVVSNQWVTLPTATPSGCSFILLPVWGKMQGGLGRLTSSVTIAVTVRKGVMNWNFTGVSLLWSGGGPKTSAVFSKDLDF